MIEKTSKTKEEVLEVLRKKPKNSDISDILNFDYVTVEMRKEIIQNFPYFFSDKDQPDNIIFLFDGFGLDQCFELFDTLFKRLETEYDDEDFEYYKTGVLMTLASSSSNRHVLRILTMIIKYNFGTMSLRGIIQEANMFYRCLEQEHKNYIMKHNNNDFFFDFAVGHES